MSDVVVTDIRFDCAWNIRGNPVEAAFVAAVTGVTGLQVPVQANGSAVRGDRRPDDSGRPATRIDDALLWLGPSSWLFVRSAALRADDFDAARNAVNAAGGALFDVSSSYVGWLVCGGNAARLLNRGCPLDFDSRVFPPGHCAQSLLGHIAALFYRPDASPAYIVMVARSFAADAGHALRAWNSG